MATTKDSVMNSSKDLRVFLIDKMKSAADGDLDIGRAKAVCNFSQQIYNTLNIEIKYAQAMEKMGDGKINPVGF